MGFARSSVLQLNDKICMIIRRITTGRKIVLFLLPFVIMSCTNRYKGEMKRANDFLQTLDGTFFPLICSYDANRLAASYLFDDAVMNIGDSVKWKIEMESNAVQGEAGATDFSAKFILEKGTMPAAGAALKFDFLKWDTANYVFAPAAVYNGNRYRVLPIGYPPYIYDEKERPLDMPVTITNVPHLNLDGTPARIEMLTSNCTTPLFGFYDKQRHRGFFLLTTQDTIHGNHGFTIEENPQEGRASFVVSSPGVREKRYVMCGSVASDDHAADLTKGDTIRFDFRLYNFEAANLMAYFDKFLSIRKGLSGENEYLNRAPFSSTSAVILDHHDKTKWYEDKKYGYICNRPEGNSPFGHLQLGWNGAPVYSLSQLIETTPERERRIARTFDAIRAMQGESGLFYGMFRHGELLGDNFNDMATKPEIAMIRRTGLTLYYGLQTLDLWRLRGKSDAINQEWEEMFRKTADGLVRLWNNYHQFGQHVNAETGEITTNNSSAGAICIAALAYASQYFGEEEYLKTAEAAGAFYYERDLKNGYVGGGPAEILQCPDSESSAELTESFVALYEITRDEKWLQPARDAAAMFSSWVVSYDYTFPEGSDMRRIDAKSTGSVWASVQNEHSAPGIYVMSGDFLFKLYRATGDERYLELGKDIAHNVVQYVTTSDNPLGIEAAPGSVTERVNISDWEGAGDVGRVPKNDSNMAWENVALLSMLQNPGIYLQTDTKRCYVFDHVNATVTTADDGNVITLEIENPTNQDANVALCIETSVEARSRSLGWNACESWRKVSVAARSTKQIKIHP